MLVMEVEVIMIKIITSEQVVAQIKYFLIVKACKIILAEFAKATAFKVDQDLDLDLVMEIQTFNIFPSILCVALIFLKMSLAFVGINK